MYKIDNKNLRARLKICFWRQWSAFLVAWCPLPAYRSCFVEFVWHWNVLLRNLWGRKWSSRPIPPPSFPIFRETLFLKKYLLYLFIWLCQVLGIWDLQSLVVACRIFSCAMWTLSCSTWGLVTEPGKEAGPPPLESWPLDHQGSSRTLFQLRTFPEFLFINMQINSHVRASAIVRFSDHIGEVLCLSEDFRCYSQTAWVQNPLLSISFVIFEQLINPFRPLCIH